MKNRIRRLVLVVVVTCVLIGLGACGTPNRERWIGELELIGASAALQGDAPVAAIVRKAAVDVGNLPPLGAPEESGQPAEEVQPE